ncbi:Transcriptional regulator [butyrate-producing bacterium SM4/1]|nr:Transcriptional regulator [butyrate-producing bacterium SM4/1]
MSDTKRRLAQALKELMAEKPIKKITIQDIVERSHMTRQSFYYHFQDIYEVIELICQYELIDQIAYRQEESFSHWLEHLMALIEENRWFYRKMLQEMEWDRVANHLKPAVEAQIRRLVGNMLTESETRSLSGGRELLVDFLTESVIQYIFRYVSCRKVPKEQNAQNLRELLQVCSLICAKCASSSKKARKSILKTG